MLKMQDLQPGQLVYSKAGRDKDRYYLVLKKQDDNMVQLVNGKNRKISFPKKKNTLHVQRTNKCYQGFSEGLAGKSINNEKISHFIKEATKDKEAGTPG